MKSFLMSDKKMRAKDWAIDAAVAAVALLFGVAQLMLEASSVIIPDLALRQYLGLVNVVPSPIAYLALAATTVPLVLRRKFPWPVLVVTSVAMLVSQYRFDTLGMPVFGPVVALFTLASERGRAETVVATALLAVGVVATANAESTALLTFFSRFTSIALLVCGALVGYAYKMNRALTVEAQLRAEQAERTREEEAARRVEAERVRIAREVHDITAHSLSAVSVQAAAAERLVERDPQAAKEAIAAVRATSKQALDDIRGMIGVLRHGDDPAEVTPTASTERLEDVCDYLRKAGVETTLDRAGYDRAQVPTHVDVALYGIAREAATNIVRHAEARRAYVCLRTVDGWAQLTVEDDGRGCGTPEAYVSGEGPAPQSDAAELLPQAADGSGHGVLGMAERVGVLGGAFSAGDVAGGGFRVIASIPLGGKEVRHG